MLNNIKHNDVHSAGRVKAPNTSHSESGVSFVEKLENNEVKLKIVTTTDVLTDLMSNAISVLLNIELLKSEDDSPVFILRDALFEDTPKEGRDQLVAMWRINQENAIKAGVLAYQFAINNGITANKAASILPVGNTMINAEIIVLENLVEYSPEGLTHECAEILEMCQDSIKSNATK